MAPKTKVLTVLDRNGVLIDFQNLLLFCVDHKNMEGIYEVSSSEKVKSLEEDLKKELKELQNEVEEGNFLSSSAAPKAFG